MTGEKVASFTQRFSQLCDEYVNDGGTQQQFASLLGVSRQTIGAWCSGDRSPKQPTVMFISDKLGVDIAWLNGFDVPRTKLFVQSSTNGDLSSLREQLRRQPGMRILFDAGKNSTEEDLIEAARMLERFKKLRDGDES